MKGSFRRPSRVAELIRMAISEILPELRDPRIGLATITEVKLSADLKHARVFVSVLGDEEDRKKTLAGLSSAAPRIRHQIAERIRLKNTPELVFTYDTSIEYGARIEELIQKTKQPPDSGSE
ncbi:MAG: 30S ribosome-binding factor RbfA [Terriglobia bacterium]